MIENPAKQVKVLYHFDQGCHDGYAAALAAWLRLGDKAEYIPVSYSNPPPEMESGSTVYIVDFSYKRPVLEKLAEEMASVTVIDHHKSAAEDLAGLPDAFVLHPGGRPKLQAHFDMEKSGAVLSYEYFHKCHAGPIQDDAYGYFHVGPVPALFLHVQDRDLWRFELEGTRELHAYLLTQPKSFARWKDVMVALSNADGSSHHAAERNYIITTGAILLEKDRLQVEQLATLAYRGYFKGHNVDMLMINSGPTLYSEVGNYLLEQNPDVGSVCIYWDVAGGRTKYSLRSRKGGVDVSAIAKGWGGGGHQAAAGFECDTDTQVIFREEL